MKRLFIAHSMLIDCGKASKKTQGLGGPFAEAGAPPFNRYNQ
jgi:hypothetical protein